MPLDKTMSAGAGPAGGRFYRPELDWLRFLAFCLVFMLHTFSTKAGDYVALGIPSAIAETLLTPLVLAGGYGVDLFFALSAFLITRLLLLERDRTGTVHIRSFYVRRILRIWPLYFAFIAVATAFELPWREHQLLYYGSLWLFMNNWSILLLSKMPITVTAHIWSISVEEQFYLVWPLLLARVRPLRFVMTLVLMFMFTCLFRGYCIYRAWPAPSNVWCNTLTHLDSFALGGLLACLLHWRNVSLSHVWRALFFVVAVVMYWQLGEYGIGGYFFGWPVWAYSMAAFGSVLCIAAACAAPPQVRIGPLKRALSYLGKISYGLYVFHLPAIRFAEYLIVPNYSQPENSWVWRVLLAGALTLAVSAASYAFLEKPFLRMKRRFTFVASRPE